MQLLFEGDEVGGTDRGGVDVFVTLEATFTGTAEELRALLADDAGLDAVFAETLHRLVPWNECDCREDWDGETDEFVDEEYLAKWVKEQGSDLVNVLPVKYADGEIINWLVCGETRNDDIHIAEHWNEVKTFVLQVLREERRWSSNLVDPTSWRLTEELFREGNAD